MRAGRVGLSSLVVDEKAVVVVKVGGVDAGSFFGSVTCPVDKVFETTAASAGVEDARDLKLFFSFDNNEVRRRGTSCARQEWVWSVALKQRDVEDRVNVHQGWECEAEGRGANLGCKLERSELLGIDLSDRQAVVMFRQRSQT